MEYYFELIAVISLFCLGLRAITDEGMIGYPIRQYFEKNFPTIGKPVVLCTTCMSSVWGTIIFWSYMLSIQSFSVLLVPNWIAISISCAFVNSIFWAYYESINTCKV